MSPTLVILTLTVLFVLWPRRIEVRWVKGRPRPAVFGIAFLALLAIAIVTTVLSAVLAPKPKAQKPASASDLADPTNDAGREMMVVFGEGVVKSGNFLWYGEKGVRSYKVSA